MNIIFKGNFFIQIENEIIKVVTNTERYDLHHLFYYYYLKINKLKYLEKFKFKLGLSFLISQI